MYIYVAYTHLSYGFVPNICATLFTKKAIFSVMQKRKLKFVQNDNHSDSFQAYQGTSTGIAIAINANNGK